MRRLSLALLAGIGAFGVLSSATRADTTIYDSNGFDLTTRFSPTYTSVSEPNVLGNLRGQDGGTWFYSGGNTATSTQAAAMVITTAEGPTNSPQQSIQVTRTSGDGEWAPLYNIDETGQTVKVTWTMNLATFASDVNFGPFFGIDGFTSGNTRLGGVGIDASDGSFQYEDSPTTFATGASIGLGWKSWEVDYNFATHTYQAFVDNVLQTPATPVPFLTPGASTFTSARIAVLQDDAQHPSDTGVAYFDDYKITATPEPTAAALLVFGLVGCGVRARRK